MSAAELRRTAGEYAAKSRREQGLSEHVSDPAVIARLVALLRPDVECKRRKRRATS